MSELKKALNETAFSPDFSYDDYKNNADKYLSRDIFKGTPIKGEYLANGAKTAYERYGVVVPLELALSQAQFESSMGKRGRNPKTNPYNVGEYDKGTQWTYPNTQAGVDAYYDLIAKDYLRQKSLDDLMKNFVNDKGNRYASNPQYEKNISNQVNYIRSYLGTGRSNPQVVH